MDERRETMQPTASRVEVSRRLLDERLADALACNASVAVFVEGLSDCFALETIAARLGRPLDDDGITIVPMGGVTNIGRFVDHFGPRGRNLRLAGLCDAGEARFVCRSLQRGGIGSDLDPETLPSVGFFVCTADLEDELIGALGVEAVEAVIEDAGELPSLRRLQQMPFHRDRSPEQHLRRFMGSRSARKYRYARLLAEAVPIDDIPRPLRDLLDHVGR